MIGRLLPFYTPFATASSTVAGVISTAAQTFAGIKTFQDGMKIGSAGTTITKIDRLSVSLTPSSVGANTTSEQTFTVTGLAVGDIVVVDPPSGMSTGLGIGGYRVSDVDTLSIIFINNTAGSLTPVSGSYLVVSVRS